MKSQKQVSEEGKSIPGAIEEGRGAQECGLIISRIEDQRNLLGVLYQAQGHLAFKLMSGGRIAALAAKPY